MSNGNVDSVKRDIMAAMIQNMPPEKRQALMQGPAGGPQPGDMGREGDMGPPPIDEAALIQEMQGVPPQMPPQGAGGPPGAPQGAGGPPGPFSQPMSPLPARPDPLLSMLAQAVPGVPAGRPTPQDEARHQQMTSMMDNEIQYQKQNNQAHTQRMGVSPQELAAATQRGRDMNPPPQGLEKGSGNALIDYLMRMSMGQ